MAARLSCARRHTTYRSALAFDRPHRQTTNNVMLDKQGHDHRRHSQTAFRSGKLASQTDLSSGLMCQTAH